MLTREENEKFTRVGPGTPLGTLLRRYWHPVAPLSRLEDEAVMPVRLLGEDLVLFRGRKGNIGLVGDRCAHRNVALAYGIPEEDGLRCPYHGWLYDRRGRCIETPLEQPHSRLKERCKIAGYPVQELGGLVFAYLGPEPPPILPPWDLFVWPNALRQIGKVEIPCNWLQCQENAADPAHSVYLHGHYFQYILERDGLLDERVGDGGVHRAYASTTTADGFDRVIAKVDRYGLRKAMTYKVARGAEADFERWHSYMVFPNMTRPGGGVVMRQEFQIRVPNDDTHTTQFNYTIYAAPPDIEVPEQKRIPSYDIPLEDEEGRPILDFVLAQDVLAWTAQGRVTDRTAEHLAGTDAAIIRFRKLLEEQLEKIERGEAPMNVFTDAAEVGKMIALEPAVVAAWGSEDYRYQMGRFRNLYHKGYWRDDADRYGPAIDEVMELMRRAEAAAAVGPAS